MRPENQTDLERAMWNCGYHKPSSQDLAEVLGTIRQAHQNLLMAIDQHLPHSREKSLCYTAIEESCMYAMAAAVRNQD